VDRGLLLDLDDTVVHSAQAQEEAWTWWCRAHGLDPNEFLALRGLTGADKIRRLAPHLDAAYEARVVAEYEIRDTRGVVAAEGAADLLVSAAPRVGIVTSASGRLARARLDAAGLAIPAVLVTADDVRHGKPHPEGYRIGARRLGVAPPACMVVEDAPAGIEAARAAGMTAIGITTTVTAQDLAAAHHVVASLVEAAEIWRRGAA
jgi:sugar-phosphatase